jgi:DNA-binding transcriptional LysR family regulator
MNDQAAGLPQISQQNRLEKQIRLRHLRVLLSIADNGGITRAAERLRVTQTAVSKVVAEIEAILGAPVLERSGRGVMFTLAGEFAATAARRIAAEVHVLAEDLDLLREGAAGLVTVGIHTVSARVLLAEAVAQMKAKYPNATVQLIDGLLPDLLKDLRAGRLDLVMARMDPLMLNPDLTGYPLEYTPYVIATSPDHPLRDRHDLTMAGLMQHAWWLPIPGTPIRDHFDKVLKTMGLEPPVNRVECNDPDIVVLIMNQMTMFGMIPVTQADYWQGLGLVSKTNILFPALPHPIGLIWSKQLPLGTTARTLRQAIMQCHGKSAGRYSLPPEFDPLTAFALTGGCN